MQHKYDLLLNALDQLRKEAPESYKTYHAISDEPLDKARSLAYIHLLLKVKFGVKDFLARHTLITDGTQDGGLDAYYIDKEHKKIYFIQSKFRTTNKNYLEKGMDITEILKMEISRITKGEKIDSNGIEYNSKIQNFQKELQDIRDVAKYDYIVIFLGNLTKINDEQIRKLIENCNYEIFNYQRAYNELLFPWACGTYFDPDEIIIRLVLKNKEHPRLKQTIDTDFGVYNVTVVFVPAIEIAKVMTQYKNSILRYNPRNYLSLQKKSVNERIRNTIIDQDKNSFALLNNGITILSENINFSESTGKQNEGQLILNRPQILNGGQTAFTLGQIFEDYSGKAKNPLETKEVLVRIITPIEDGSTVDHKFIELISNATNQQNEVSEADRRSNHAIQIELQKTIYDQYGFLYERKTGEFHDGLANKIVPPDQIIDRLDFIKAYYAYGGDAASARRTSEDVLFQEDNFYKILNNVSRYKEMFFAYIIFRELESIEKTFKKKTDSISKYGYSLMYGKWAVVASIGITKPIIPDKYEELVEFAKTTINKQLEFWKEFDSFIQQKRKSTKYFAEGRNNIELYYKINMIDEDIKEFFLK
jgi:hypothetical protein